MKTGVTIQLDVKTLSQLDEKAAALRVSRGKLIRDMVEKAISQTDQPASSQPAA